MAWATPRTWNAGDLVSAAQLNEQVRDNENILKSALDNSGKIIALSSTYLANLSGANLTGIAKLASGNTFTTGTHTFNGGSGTRLIIPVGASKWST